jgi:hypothetical protein
LPAISKDFHPLTKCGSRRAPPVQQYAKNGGKAPGTLSPGLVNHKMTAQAATAIT